MSNLDGVLEKLPSFLHAFEGVSKTYPAKFIDRLTSFLHAFEGVSKIYPAKFIDKFTPFLGDFKKINDVSQSLRYSSYIRDNGEFLTNIKGVLKASHEMKRQEAPSFNAFNILDIARRELAATAMWKDLLDPNGYHEQGDLFLHPFLELIDDKLKSRGRKCDSYAKLPISSWVTSAEKFVRKVQSNDKNGRVDVYLKHLTTNSAIAIEYKIDAVDQERQIVRYYEHLEAQKFGQCHVVYIHPTGEKPSKDSLGYLDEDIVVCISIRYELVPILVRILKSNNHIPKKVRYFIEDYIEVAAK